MPKPTQRNAAQPTAPDAAAGVSGFLPPIKLNNIAHATAVEPRGQPQGHVPVNGRTDGKQVRRAVASGCNLLTLEPLAVDPAGGPQENVRLCEAGERQGWSRAGAHRCTSRATTGDARRACAAADPALHPKRSAHHRSESPNRLFSASTLPLSRWSARRRKDE